MAAYRPCKCGCGRLVSGDDRRWYATDNCRKQAYRNRHTISRQKSAGKRRVNLCAYCGREFVPRQHNQRCCKPAHKQALYRELKALRNQ